MVARRDTRASGRGLTGRGLIGLVAMRSRTKLLGLCALALLASTACGGYLKTGALVVNGVGISRADVDKRVTEQLAQQGGGAAVRDEAARGVILSLIQQEIVRQEAAKRKIVIPPAKIDAEIDRIKSQIGSQEEFDSQLKKAGLTLRTLRDRLRESLTVDQLRLTLSPAVTDAQLLEVYTRSPEQFAQVRVRHILFRVNPAAPAAAEAKAKKVAAQIKAGASFTALARAQSEDPASAARGGDLGFIARGQQPPEFEQAAFSAKIGAVVGPIRSQLGFDLLRVDAKRVQPFAEVKDQLRQQLEGEVGRTSLQEFLQGALRVASIVVNPRYGDWDAASGEVVAHASFEPAAPAVDPSAPGQPPAGGPPEEQGPPGQGPPGQGPPGQGP